MTDANEALRALDNALDLASQVDGWESFPLEPLEKALDAMEVIRARLTDPGYVRVPDIGGHLMNECAWAFIEAMPEGAERGSALTSTWLKPALHAAFTELLAAATKDTSHD